MPQGRRRWGKGVGEWNRPVGGYGREWSAGQTREDLTSSEGVPLPGCTADAAGTAFQQKWRFQVGEWNLPSFKNRRWIHKFKTHPTSRAKPSWGPRLAQSLPVCDLGVNESYPVYTMGVTLGPPGSRHWHRDRTVEGLLGLTMGETVAEGAGKHSGQNVDLTPSLNIILS